MQQCGGADAINSADGKIGRIPRRVWVWPLHVTWSEDASHVSWGCHAIVATASTAGNIKPRLSISFFKRNFRKGGESLRGFVASPQVCPTFSEISFEKLSKILFPVCS